MKALLLAAVVAIVLAGSAGSAVAQDAGAAAAAPTCDARDAAAKRQWASRPHAWLASVFQKERRDLADSWCRIWETSGRDRIFKAENFGRVLFTSDGIHPAVSSALVPGSGFAGGAALSLARASASRPLRFAFDADTMASTNGSWTTGIVLGVLGSGRRDDNRHIQQVIEARHQHLAALDYYGPSNDSARADRTSYGLDKTLVGTTLTVPLAGGFAATATAAAARFDPGASGDTGVPPPAVRFTEATTPAITTTTSYAVVGFGATWRYPLDATTTGYRGAAGATWRAFHETAGRPYSFQRVDLEWANAYTPSAPLGTLTATAFATLSYTSGANRVPFYLQPTVGGTDLFSRSALRSFQDYRYRAPNVLGLSLEHERTIKDFVGSLLFADFARVADTRGGLGIGGMHRSFGAGITLRAGNTTVLRIFYAWGGGETTRTTFSGGSGAFGQGPSAGLAF